MLYTNKIDSLWYNVHLATMAGGKPDGAIENGAMAVRKHNLPVKLHAEQLSDQGAHSSPPVSRPFPPIISNMFPKRVFCFHFGIIKTSP